MPAVSLCTSLLSGRGLSTKTEALSLENPDADCCNLGNPAGPPAWEALPSLSQQPCFFHVSVRMPVDQRSVLVTFPDIFKLKSAQSTSQPKVSSSERRRRWKWRKVNATKTRENIKLSLRNNSDYNKKHISEKLTVSHTSFSLIKGIYAIKDDYRIHRGFLLHEEENPNWRNNRPCLMNICISYLKNSMALSHKSSIQAF